jgi:hypothetical protein
VAVPGQDLVYIVTLTNHGRQTLSLSPCPSYTEHLTEVNGPNTATSRSTYLLNCQMAGQVPAGGSLSFQMKLHVPAQWSPGPAKLLWNLEVAGQPAAGSTLQVN